MSVLLAASLEEVFEGFERFPDAQLLAGGTDFMVEVSFAHRRPPAVVCLRKVDELTGWRIEGTEVVLGAGVTYTELMRPPLSDLLPGLAQAARTVGSPQIRNAGTLGGNIGNGFAGRATRSRCSPPSMPRSSSPAGKARRNLRSRRAHRRPEAHHALQPARSSSRSGSRPALGSQEFLKVGTRNAMVIAVANAAVVVDWDRPIGPVRARLGRPRRRFVPARRRSSSPRGSTGRSGRLAERTDGHRGVRVLWCARPRSPIDDHRSTAAYSRHAAGVCARARARARSSRASHEASRGARHGRADRLPAPGQRRASTRSPRPGSGENLLYVLRERLGLPGSKNACEQGECGSCSVLMDGTLVCACMVLAASAVGADIVTVEGLSPGEDVSSRTSRRRSWPKARFSAGSARRDWS